MEREPSHSMSPIDDDWLLFRLEIREAFADYRRHIAALAEILRQDIRALTDRVHEASAKLDKLQR